MRRVTLFESLPSASYTILECALSGRNGAKHSISFQAMKSRPRKRFAPAPRSALLFVSPMADAISNPSMDQPQNEHTCVEPW